jgi:tRNA-binding protein
MSAMRTAQPTIAVGTVLEATAFPEGRHSTHILHIDFGDNIGIKKSLARLAPNYVDDEMIGQQILAIIDLEPKQIGHHMSEVLTLAVPDEHGNAILIKPERPVPNGGLMY